MDQHLDDPRHTLLEQAQQQEQDMDLSVETEQTFAELAFGNQPLPIVSILLVTLTTNFDQTGIRSARLSLNHPSITFLASTGELHSSFCDFFFFFLRPRKTPGE